MTTRMVFANWKIGALVLSTVLVAGCGSATEPVAGADPADLAIESAVIGHPTGQSVVTLPLAADPFGTAVSRKGIAYVTQLFANQVSAFGIEVPVFRYPVAVGSIPTDVAFHPTRDRAYVTNQLSQNVGVIDVATRTQTTTIPIAGDPFRVRLDQTGARLYVTSNGDNLTVINTQTNAVIKTLAVGLDPNGLAFSPDGSRLFVSNQSDGTIAEVNTATLQVTRTLQIGGTPQEIVMSPDGATLYLANQTGDLQLIDVASGLVTRSVTFGGAPFAMALSPDGAQLYLATTLSGQIHILDRITLAELQTITTNGLPRRISFARNGRVAVIADQVAGVVFVK